MQSAVQVITIADIAIVFVPVVAVVGVLWRWSVGAGIAVHALARMLVQLLLVGHVLAFVFGSDSALVVSAVLSVMVLAASWIALRPLRRRDRATFARALLAILCGSAVTLAFVTQGALELDAWYRPNVIIPLAGMALSNAMNAVSVAAERLESEIDGGVDWLVARRAALNAALIPQMNSLFAVGLVSLPGMMTGQILSGIDPLIAVRYQIIVMCMVFSSAGFATIGYLLLQARSARMPAAAASG